jgi:hypothetical protein
MLENYTYAYFFLAHCPSHRELSKSVSKVTHTAHPRFVSRNSAAPDFVLSFRLSQWFIFQVAFLVFVCWLRLHAQKEPQLHGYSTLLYKRVHAPTFSWSKFKNFSCSATVGCDSSTPMMQALRAHGALNAPNPWFTSWLWSWKVDIKKT